MARGDQKLKESPSQTAGPYVHIGFMPNAAGIAGVFPDDPGAHMVAEETDGQRISVSGVIYDGADAPLTDAVIELWQADAQGRYPDGDPHRSNMRAFQGWGRAAADPETGFWQFATIKPGRSPDPEGGLQAPHLTIWIVARGINVGLHTRLYFPDEDNSGDFFLSRIEPPDRIDTLIAAREGENSYRFDIHLQGARETVFFDV